MFISKYQLIVFPENPNDSVESDHLCHLLKTIGFIGDAESLEDNSDSLRFQTGDKFLSNIGFLGCSPDIELEPQTDKPYTYIEITQSTDWVQFVSGINIKIPRCPDCKKDLSDLPERMSHSQKPGQEPSNTFSCLHCNISVDPYKLNFRKSAFFARTYIIIGNIYESEAVPDDYFLMALKKETGFNWKYAYVRFA